MKKKETMKNNYLTFQEMMYEYKKRPKSKYLWSGIKEKSFGLVFGPSKSGKTIFCENLAMKIASGAKDYLGYELEGIPKKVLFIGLEEFWLSRAERNMAQYSSLNDEEKKLINNNYLYQSIDFSKHIVKKTDWENLDNVIKESKAEIVFIDSITRMNHGSLEDSKTAEEIMQRLRSICYDNKITLICIHHTPKMHDAPITMDRIKGSSTFSQEADFAIGINKTTKGYRYQKNVFFRYAPDDDETVKEFEINESTWLRVCGEDYENKILERSDRRRNNEKREKIVEYINTNSSTTHRTQDLVKYFTETLSIQDRQIKSYLKDLSNDGDINNPSHGVYISVNYNKENDERVD